MEIMCTDCGNSFEIDEDRKVFYQKIGTPFPTRCPNCRIKRRFLWRNERTLYKRKCDLCGKQVIGLYREKTPFPVYCHACWFSDKWDAADYGREYDFSRSFFEQFGELMRSVPRVAVFNSKSVNSEYTNQSYNNKNVYLSFAIRDCEDCGYLTRATGLKDSFDSVYTHHSESLYGCIDVDKSYRSRFLQECEGCTDSAFLFNCRNCSHCIGGVNLRSASYVFFGEKMTKELWEKKVAELEMGDYETIERLSERFEKLKRSALYRPTKIVNCTTCKGDHLSNAKDCIDVFDGFDLENGFDSSWVFTTKDFAGVYGVGGSELVYESIGVEDVSAMKFGNVCETADNSEYVDLCFNVSNLFGCIGLKNKERCILNKQYTKDEYFEMRKKVIAHMKEIPYRDANGKGSVYGDFFPSALAPFAYNETIAEERFPITKKEANTKGLHWEEFDSKDYRPTISTKQIPRRIADVKDNISKEVIECKNASETNRELSGCTSAFKITPQELTFYRKLNIPLPHLCPNCRHYKRLQQRNPVKLWHRKCQCGGVKSENGVYANTVTHSHGDKSCLNEFETSYSPDREETIYCEACYQKEVV